MKSIKKWPKPISRKKTKPQFLVWKFVKIIWLTRKICRICRTPKPLWRAHFSSNPAGQSSENSNKALIRQTCLWGGRIGSHRKVLCKTTNLLLLVHIEASNASFPWNEYHNRMVIKPRTMDNWKYETRIFFFLFYLFFFILIFHTYQSVIFFFLDSSMKLLTS